MVNKEIMIEKEMKVEKKIYIGSEIGGKRGRGIMVDDR